MLLAMVLIHHIGVQANQHLLCFLLEVVLHKQMHQVRHMWLTVGQKFLAIVNLANIQATEALLEIMYIAALDHVG